MIRQLLPARARTLLISALGGDPTSTPKPQAPLRDVVGGWVAAECIRDPDARFNMNAAFASMRVYQAERMLPMPTRKVFRWAAASLGLPTVDGHLVGVRPRNPACLEKAGIESVAYWLCTRVELDAGGSTEIRVAWADYARAVAPRIPSTGFVSELVSRGFTIDGPRLRGIRLR